MQVQGITDAIDVSVGHWHACAVLSTGGVRCWGYRGSTGSLGDGVAGVECGFYGCTPDQTTAYSAVPVEVVGIADARDVACMDRFCCAMRSGNRVSCWGTGTNGQLGDGRNVSSSTPVDVVGLPSDTTLARFSTGFANALCVITGDGIPLCWGNVPAVGSSSTPTPLFGLTNVVDVSLEGYYFVMGTFGGGNGGLVRRRNASGGYEVLAWGDDESGQNGSATAGYSSPGLTSLPMPDAIAIARMAHTSCVIRADGMPWCVGRSIYVGDGLCPRTSTTTYDAAICLP